MKSTDKDDSTLFRAVRVEGHYFKLLPKGGEALGMSVLAGKNNIVLTDQTDDASAMFLALRAYCA